MWIDIQVGPVVMWAWELAWTALALACMAMAGIAFHNRIIKGSKASATGWLLLSILMAHSALRWGNKIAYWYCQAWPHLCG